MKDAAPVKMDKLTQFVSKSFEVGGVHLESCTNLEPKPCKSPADGDTKPSTEVQQLDLTTIKAKPMPAAKNWLISDINQSVLSYGLDLSINSVAPSCREPSVYTKNKSVCEEIESGNNSWLKTTESQCEPPHLEDTKHEPKDDIISDENLKQSKSTQDPPTNPVDKDGELTYSF